MKKFNHILLAAICATSLAFVACEDEAEYTPAGADTASGVYFSTESPSTINLSKEATSFDVEVFRGDDAADAAVELIVNISEENAGKLSIPTVANFAKGSKVANVTIGYDPTTLEYEDWIKVQLIVKDEAARSPYAEYSYAFSAGIPAPYTKVVAANGDETATYREDLVTTFFGVENLVYDLEIRENDITPGIYRLVNPYGEAYEYNAPGEWDDSRDYYIEIDATDPTAVVLNYTNLGCDWGYGEFVCWSLANYYMVRKGATKEDMKAEGLTGTLVDGIITFPAQSLLFGMSNYNNGALYTSNANGLFAIALPGYEITDYTVDVQYLGKFTDTADAVFAVGSVTLGEDVEAARVAMVAGDDINAAVAGIIDGSISSTEISESTADIRFALEEAGTYSIVAVTYAEGEAKELGYVTFDYTTTASAWNKLGTGLYTDDIMTTFYNVENVTYEVEIEESSEQPGLYRIVYPYGPAYPYNAEGDYDASKKYYLEVNACDPGAVYLTQQLQGLDWGNGMLIASSLADMAMTGYGYTLEDCVANGFCGTLVDGVITFPAEMLGVGLTEYDNGDIYTANLNGAFCVVLPDAYATMSTTSFKATTVGNSAIDRTVRQIMPATLFNKKMIKRTNDTGLIWK